MGARAAQHSAAVAVLLPSRVPRKNCPPRHARRSGKAATLAANGLHKLESAKKYLYQAAALLKALTQPVGRGRRLWQLMGGTARAGRREAHPGMFQGGAGGRWAHVGAWGCRRL